MTRMVERLAAEFDSLPVTAVVRVATDCAQEWPAASALFLEEAARARLRKLAE